MRIRDALIVAIACVLCIVAWNQEGTLNIQPGFKISINDPQLHTYNMPKPLLLDAKGDGRPMLYMAGTTHTLHAIETWPTRRNVEKHFVSLRHTFSRTFPARIIGIGGGNLNLNSSEKTLFVLTDDYMLSAVLAVNPLHTLWKVKVAPDANHVVTLQASIIARPERVYLNDEGTVIVAVKATNVRGMELILYAAFNGRGELRWRYFSDAGGEMDDVLAETDIAAREMMPLEMEMPRLRANATDAAGRIPGSPDMANRVYEKPWSTFREAVSAALPHRYAHPWHAQLRPHVFYNAKNTQGKKIHSGGTVTVIYKDRVVRVSKEDYGLLGEKLNMHTSLPPHHHDRKPATSSQRHPANALVYHGKYGMEFIHLYTGSILTSVVPLKSHRTYYHDIDDDFHIDALRTQVGLLEGVDTPPGYGSMVECLGKILTGAPVAEDKLFSTSICDTEGFLGSLDLIHRFVDGDIRGEEMPHMLSLLHEFGSRRVVTATTSSVMPIVAQTHTSKGRGIFQVERFAIFLIDTGLVTCVDPTRLRVMWRSQTGAIFTPKAEDRNRMPRVHALGDDDGEGLVKPFPHLATYSLHHPSIDDDADYVGGGKDRYGRTDPYVLAVGETDMAVINTKSGKVVRTVPLIEPPIGPVLVVDFNGDGTNDIILVSATHVYGFIGRSQASSSTITALMVLMVALLALLFIVREVNLTEVPGKEFQLPVTSTDPAKSSKTMKRATD